MLRKLRGIVLSTIRHNDKTDIVTLFTREAGRVAFVSAVSRSRTARMRNAMLSPLAIVDTEVNFHENKDLQILGALTCPHPWRNLYFDPMKGAMVIFLSEFLSSLLRTQEPDPNLWNFLLTSIHHLDVAPRGIANYHLAFLIRMLPIAGIEPDLEGHKSGHRAKITPQFDAREGQQASSPQASVFDVQDGRQAPIFDMREGRFVDIHPHHSDIIIGEEALALPVLMRMNYRTMHLYQMNVEQRRRLLSRLMHYYAIHLPIRTDLRSLDILRELFS